MAGNSKMASMAAGAAAGALLMALAVILVFGMGTGIGGAALIILTMAVAGSTGFLMGRMYRAGNRKLPQEKEGQPPQITGRKQEPSGKGGIL